MAWYLHLGHTPIPCLGIYLPTPNIVLACYLHAGLSARACDKVGVYTTFLEAHLHPPTPPVSTRTRAPTGKCLRNPRETQTGQNATNWADISGVSRAQCYVECKMSTASNAAQAPLAFLSRATYTRFGAQGRYFVTRIYTGACMDIIAHTESFATEGERESYIARNTPVHVRSERSRWSRLGGWLRGDVA